jgi:hypothetical protein
MHQSLVDQPAEPRDLAGDPAGPGYPCRVSTLTKILIYALALVILAVVAVRAGRLSRQRGYRFGRDVIVRCRDGHLFTTTWIPMVSFKAIRLGLVRYQYCPVGDHSTAVRLMRDEDLTPAERLEASRHHDNGVP